MGQLFEVVLRYWFIVIILIAVFSAFRKKRKESQESSSGMPPFGGQRPPKEASRHSGYGGQYEREADRNRTIRETQQAGRTGTSPFGRPASVTEPQSSGSPYGDAGRIAPFLDDDEPPALAWSDLNIRPESISTAGSRSRPSGNSGRTGSLTPNRSTLAKAVVWSEILGPPRAKKPYRRR